MSRRYDQGRQDRLAKKDVTIGFVVATDKFLSGWGYFCYEAIDLSVRVLCETAKNAIA